VRKWVKNAKEGIVVAGGQGRGNKLNQLDTPQGVIVNEMGDVYVADQLRSGCCRRWWIRSIGRSKRFII